MRDLDDRIRSGRRVRRCHIEVRILEPHMPNRITDRVTPCRFNLLLVLTKEEFDALGAKALLVVTNCHGHLHIAELVDAYGIYVCCEFDINAHGILFLQQLQDAHFKVRFRRLDNPLSYLIRAIRLCKDTMGHDFVLSVAAHKICAGIIIDIVRNVCRLHSAVHKIQFERRGPRLVCPFRQIHGYVLAFKRILVTAHIQGPVDF
mmetsp:Transcript_74460/g.159579  ORF Transcript_74460/g.159579 Transcript_74460/m.159579 type:complete len:204 (-) Transcript_74460:378-989(-)